VHAVAFDAITVHVINGVQPDRSGADFLVRFPSLAGRNYRVEQSADLSPGSWTTLADNLPGTGGILAIQDAGALGFARKFYRVKMLP